MTKVTSIQQELCASKTEKIIDPPRIRLCKFYFPSPLPPSSAVNWHTTIYSNTFILCWWQLIPSPSPLVSQFTPYTFSVAVSRHFSNLLVQMPMCRTIFEQGVSKRRKFSRTTFSFQMAWQIILRKYVWWEKYFWLAVVLVRFKVCNVFFDKCNSRGEIGSVITVNLTVQRKGYNEKPILK